MADDTTSSGAGPLVKTPGNTLAEVEKAPRYHNPYSISPVIKGRNYARSIVSSQEMMLENLRYMRRQLDKDDKKLEVFQKDLYLDNYPKKWRHNDKEDGGY